MKESLTKALQDAKHWLESQDPREFIKEFESLSSNGMSEDDKVFARERLLFNIVEDILVFMEDNEISKRDLAMMLGSTEEYVSDILSCESTLTLENLAHICFVLGISIKITW